MLLMLMLMLPLSLSVLCFRANRSCSATGATRSKAITAVATAAAASSAVTVIAAASTAVTVTAAVAVAVNIHWLLAHAFLSLLASGCQGADHHNLIEGPRCCNATILDVHLHNRRESSKRDYDLQDSTQAKLICKDNRTQHCSRTWTAAGMLGCAFLAEPFKAKLISKDT
eukprot:1139507-Pelagomonas_calceolata.AAC.6